jgi:hypothetical protein
MPLSLRMDTELGVPIDPQDPEVLRTINAVRTRMGWEPLPAVPVSDPHNSCACVFGSSWGMSIEPENSIPDHNVYEFVDLVTHIPGLAEAVNEIVNDGSQIVGEFKGSSVFSGSDYAENNELWSVRVPGAHPLMRWMWQFDHHEFGSLVGKTAVQPVSGYASWLTYDSETVRHASSYQYPVAVSP